MGVNVDVTVFKLNNVYPSAVQHAVEASQHLRLEAFYVYFEEVNVFNSLRGAVAISGSHRYRAGFWMVIMEGFGEICNARCDFVSFRREIHVEASFGIRKANVIDHDVCSAAKSISEIANRFRDNFK